MEGYLIEVQGGVIAEGTDGGQFHQPIILPCPDWFIILQAGDGMGEEGRRETVGRTESEMQRERREAEWDREELGRW
jgi:hypothetical protein